MSIIYNRVYKVQSWIVLDTKDTKKTQELLAGFKKEGGVHEVKWISKEFPITVNELARQGWAHEVNRPMPLTANPDFLMVAVSKHIRLYGASKSLSGTPEKPVSSINRKVNNGDDYVRIFDSVLENEPAMSLSYIFDIGELCYMDNSRIKTFITVGPVAKKVLQKVSDNVITISDSEDSGEIVIDGCQPEDAIRKVIEKVVK